MDMVCLSKSGFYYALLTNAKQCYKALPVTKIALPNDRRCRILSCPYWLDASSDV
ncbi:hypothetical protein D3C72_2275070 [compost metagenome]